jgi:protease I
VVFVGGSGSKQYFEDPEALEIAKKAYEKGKIVAAICIAPVILANAGILKGKKATVHHGNEQELEKKGANYINQNVVKDGKIITACGPSAAREFGNTIAKEIKNV